MLSKEYYEDYFKNTEQDLILKKVKELDELK